MNQAPHGERRAEGVTDASLRTVILTALEDYTFRLKDIFVSRAEFQVLEAETRNHEGAIASLRGALENLSKEVRFIGRVIERAAWAIVLAMAGAIFTAVASLIFK